MKIKYYKQNCKPCENLATFCNENGFKFDAELDISTLSEEEMKKVGLNYVPAIAVDGVLVAEKFEECKKWVICTQMK